jgi:glycosyltransferase involved in cell wall biosynthesis
MNPEQITVLILTANEEENIASTLERLDWAPRVVVLDSGSTDRTVEICSRFPQVEVIERRFDNHRDQWNYGLDQVESDWVLTLDADYKVGEDFVAALKAVEPASELAGYRVPLIYCIRGAALRASLLPPRIALFRIACGRYIQDGHTQDLVVEGRVEDFPVPIDHDDRKPFRRWLSAQKRYARLEVEKLSVVSWGQLSPQDKLRRMMVPAPPAVLLYCLLVKGLLFQGPPGWLYSIHRVIAECILSAYLARALFNK